MASWIICKVPHPTSKPNMIATTTALWFDDTKCGIRLGWDTGYCIADEDAGTFTLYDGSGNVLDSCNTLSVADNSLQPMEISYSDGALRATFQGCCLEKDASPGSDPYCYLYGGPAKYTNFSLAKTKSTHEPKDENCVHPHCPETATCTDCCDPDHPPSGVYIVDLGVGGWTYADTCATAGSSCDACEDANGEFVVLKTGTFCFWEYEDRHNCAFPCVTGFFGAPGDPPIFSIVLQLNKDGTGCRWEVVVSMTTSAGTASFDCDPAGAKNTVTYRSDYLASMADCQLMPVTLTKVSEAGDCPCSGSLPATITLESAT